MKHRFALTCLLSSAATFGVLAEGPAPMNTEFTDGCLIYTVFINNTLDVKYDIYYMGTGSCSDEGLFPSPASITVPDQMTFDGYTYPVTTLDICAFQYLGQDLTQLNLPSTLQWIRSSAIDACRVLSSIDIPETVWRIDQNAFHDCRALTEVAVPWNVTRIAADSFSGCSAMERLVMLGELGSGFNGGFSGLPESCTLYLPADAYDLATGWSGNKEKLGPYVEEEGLEATPTGLRFMLEDSNLLDAYVNQVSCGGQVLTPDSQGFYSYTPADKTDSYTLKLKCEVMGHYYEDTVTIPVIGSGCTQLQAEPGTDNDVWFRPDGTRVSKNAPGLKLRRGVKTTSTF